MKLIFKHMTMSPIYMFITVLSQWDSLIEKKTATGN